MSMCVWGGVRFPSMLFQGWLGLGKEKIFKR